MSFSAQQAQRLFREESDDLFLCSYETIEKASALFENEGDHAGANDIISRYEDGQEDLACLMAEFM